MKTSHRNRLTGRVLSALLGVTASAPVPAAPADYHPPTGFNGLSWGAPLVSLGKIRLARANTVTDSWGKTTQLRCTESPGGCAGFSPSDQDIEGRGSFAVAEYYRESDSNPWAGALVALNSATYMFCDEWLGSSTRVDVKQHLQFCGARIFYRSENSDQLAGKPSGFETNHDRLLHHLIREYGPPDGYPVRRGTVTAGPVLENGEEPAPQDSRPEAATNETGQGVTRYRWCGLNEGLAALLPDCSATITLLFNHDTGWGMLLFATESVYKFAQARHATKDENNELYMALVSKDPRKPTRHNANGCMRTTGSLVCTGELVALPASERKRFEP